MLISAGPTHEPVDAVRYLGNRSSGRLGVALAEHAADRGWDVTLLLGPTHTTTDHPSVDLVRFRTTEDLRLALERHLPSADALVMAAAVADYRPIPPKGLEGKDLKATKLRRETDQITITCEPTPDLLKGCSDAARDEQLLVGFALEPRDQLLESAARKLNKKGIDLIVGNPLETMDAACIEATLIGPNGVEDTTDGPIDKSDFAPWLIERLASHPKMLALDESNSTAGASEGR